MSSSYIWSPDLKVQADASRLFRVLDEVPKEELIVMPASARCTEEKLVELVENPENIIRGTTAGTRLATIAEETINFRPTGREENTSKGY